MPEGEDKDQKKTNKLCPVHPHICLRQLLVEALLAALLYTAIALYVDHDTPSLENCTIWVVGYVAIGVILQGFEVSYQSQLERVVGFAIASKLWSIINVTAAAAM